MTTPDPQTRTLEQQALDILRKVFDSDDLTVQDADGYCNFCYWNADHDPDCGWVAARNLIAKAKSGGHAPECEALIYSVADPECILPCTCGLDALLAPAPPQQNDDLSRSDHPRVIRTSNPRDDDRIYPCRQCGVLRSKNEGGTTFTVCDECWDKPDGSASVVASEASASPSRSAAPELHSQSAAPVPPQTEEP